VAVIIGIVAAAKHRLVLFLGPIGIVQTMGSIEMGFAESGNSHNKGFEN
jgi:hypothetical protein